MNDCISYFAYPIYADGYGSPVCDPTATNRCFPFNDDPGMTVGTIGLIMGILGGVGCIVSLYGAIAYLQHTMQHRRAASNV